MPLVRTPLTGNQIVAMGSVSLQRNYTLTTNPVAGTNTFIVNEIPVGGLPSLTYWVRLNTALAGVIFDPVFAVQNLTTTGTTTPDWRPFTNGNVLVPNNIFVFNIRSAVAMSGAQFSFFGGIPATFNVDVIITAGG